MVPFKKKDGEYLQTAPCNMGGGAKGGGDGRKKQLTSITEPDWGELWGCGVVMRLSKKRNASYTKYSTE